MAIDWKVKFTLKSNGHYSALFERFDTLAPNVILESVPILDVILETDQQKENLWAQIWAEHESQASVNSTIASLESAAKAALLAKEK